MMLVSRPSRGEADAAGGVEAIADETTVVAKATRERERDVFIILKLG